MQNSVYLLVLCSTKSNVVKYDKISDGHNRMILIIELLILGTYLKRIRSSFSVRLRMIFVQDYKAAPIIENNSYCTESNF